MNNPYYDSRALANGSVLPVIMKALKSIVQVFFLTTGTLEMNRRIF